MFRFLIHSLNRNPTPVVCADYTLVPTYPFVLRPRELDDVNGYLQMSVHVLLKRLRLYEEDAEIMLAIVILVFGLDVLDGLNEAI